MGVDLRRAEDVSSIDLRIPLSILRCLGLWPARGSRRWYSLCVPLALTSKVFTQVGLVVTNWGSLADLAMTLCIMITILSGIFKSTTFLICRPRLDRLLDALAKCHQVYEPERKRRCDAILRTTAARSFFMASSFLSLGGLALILFLLHPALQNVLSVQSAEEIAANITRERNLPSLAWYPFDHRVSPNYEAVYVYDSATLFCIYICTSTLDTFYVTIIIFITGQMRILNDNLLHLLEDSLAKLRLGRRKEVTHARVALAADDLEFADWANKDSVEYKKLEDEMNSGIAQCVTHHMAIMHAIRELEFVMSPACLMQFLASMIVICMTAFTVTMTTSDLGQVSTYVSYLLTMLYELALYCWYGNDIIEEGENVRVSAYGSDWTGMSPRTRSALKVVMEHARKELKLTGGKFYTLSRETFLMLVNGSYSYFAVLTQMND